MRNNDLDNIIGMDCPLAPDKKNLPKGQDHILEISQSDRITIKCGGASIVVYPTGRVMRKDEETGMMYWDLILGQEPDVR